MRYKRDSSARILTLSRFFPAVVLTGARQTGKTTLLKTLFPTYNYVSLDLPSKAAEANHDPTLFLTKHKPPLIIDEVQYAPELFRHLKVVIDQDRDRNGQYILTGSQKFVLMKSVSESLAGRVGLAELDTLAPEELGEDLKRFVQAHGIARLMVRGFFPGLWDNQDVPSHEFYSSYIATYLERDVRQILNVSSLRDFERFMRACAIRNGNILNKSELAKDVGIHHKTANDWLSVMEASNQIVLLEPYFSNETKRIVKSPKLFFTDTGLLCALLGLRENSITDYANIGMIWETLIFSRLRKRELNFCDGNKLWFFRDNLGLEVDFVVESAGKLDLIESKWTQYPDKKSTQSFLKLKSKLSNINESKVACRTDFSFPIDGASAVHGLFDHLTSFQA